MASEYLKWKYRDVKPGEPQPSLTGWPKIKNWLYYNWKWIAVIAAVLAAVVNLITWSLDKMTPDYTLAYVGRNRLTEETEKALLSALQALGEDVNGDGEVMMELQSYVTVDNALGADTAEYNTAVSVRLLADLTAGESVFFVTDDPEGLQTTYQILASPDGTQPAEDDLGWEGKAHALADLPALHLGDVAGFYIGRRWFNEDMRQDSKDDVLWAAIVAGAASPGLVE